MLRLIVVWIYGLTQQPTSACSGFFRAFMSFIYPWIRCVIPVKPVMHLFIVLNVRWTITDVCVLLYMDATIRLVSLTFDLAYSCI